MNNSTQYNPLFDYLKGVAIFFVLLEHSILRSNLDIIHSWFYIGQAVPIFLLIQAYHTTRKLEITTIREYFRLNSIYKILNRIIKPFIIVQFICVILLVLTNQLDIKRLLLFGGYGPGAYYPFVYIQAWIILPLLIFTLNKFTKTKATVIVIVICIITEAIYIIYDPYFIPYRLFVGRYIFLLYLGCMWRKSIIPKIFYFLAIVSMILVLLEFHHYFINSKLVYNTIWTGYHWWAYFYTLAFLSLLIYIYKKVLEFSFTNKIEKLGKASYEVLMVQMLVFGFIKEEFFLSLLNVNDNLVVLLISFSVVLLNICLSIYGGLFIYKQINRHG